MSAAIHAGLWQRRAQPLLGTLVEVGVAAADEGAAGAADAAFSVLRDVQACLSRFEPDSDIGRFNALRGGAGLTLRPMTRSVLLAADELRQRSGGAFDISLGSGCEGWRCVGDRLEKLHDGVQLDLGGIGKGYAVDCAVRALVASGARAGWVNGGGDLRVFGAVELPIRLRDEEEGGVRWFATLHEGAFATSRFDDHSRSRLAGRDPQAAAAPAHVSVAAPACMWADALTKLVALSGDATHPLLARYGARAWLH